MLNIFQERKTKLANGQNVREGDLVHYYNSDHKKVESLIQRRKFKATHQETGKILKEGTLFFWNIGFSITDYKSLTLS